jgi:hypothetical protein
LINLPHQAIVYSSLFKIHEIFLEEEKTTSARGTEHIMDGSGLRV